MSEAPESTDQGREAQMRDVGAAKARRSLLAVARERHGVLQGMLTAGRGEMSVEEVHDLRVATRRLTEVVGLFEPLMESAMAKVAGESLRGLRKAAGALRDLDVMEEHLAAARLPAAVKRVVETIRAGYAEQRAGLVGRLIEAASAASVSGAMVYLARVFEELAAKGDEPAEGGTSAAAKGDPGGESTGGAEGDLAGDMNGMAAGKKLVAALGKRVRRRRKQLRAAVGRAAVKQSPAALHAARIAVKKLRYVLELGSESGEKGGRGELKQLKAMQKVLGDHHDVHVIHETIGGHLPAAGRVKGLRPAWGKVSRRVAREQAGRAVEFFRRAYLWNQG